MRKIASHDKGMACETRNLIEGPTSCVNSQPCGTSGTQSHNFDRDSYQNPMMMRRFINEELPKRPNRTNMSVAVARLMGVEDDPCEEDGMNITSITSTETFLDLDAFYPIEEGTGRPPPRREHPQDDELQKFKKDFVAFREKFLVPFKNQKLTVSPESSSASNIVILQSGYRRSTNERKSNITELLEEVKLRLKSEFSGIDDRKLFACQIAEKVRERVVPNLSPTSQSFNKFPVRVSPFRYDVNESHSRSLPRSSSAPTSFNQLLIEDRNMLTGAHVRRKEEVIHVASKSSLYKKFAFLKGKFFGSKVESSRVTEKPNESLFFVNIAERRIHENPTEVPSTPVSSWDVWSSFPVSPPDVSPEENLAFAKIAANLNDLRRQLDKRYNEPEGLEAEEPRIDDKAELYVRDLLVESGLYHGPVGILQSNHHDVSKLVSISVFEKLEALSKGNLEKSDRRMLFDLLNEVLSSTDEPKKESSSEVLTGRKLLDCVWKVMSELDNERGISLDEMVARSIGSTRWLGLGFDGVWLVKEIEWLISSDLICEIAIDLFRV